MKARNAYCSFCRKSYEHVGPLVEGPGEVYICSECVSLCQSILDQERRRRNLAPAVTVQSVRATLDQLVLGQEHAKSVLAEAALRRSDGTGRVLLIGSSRSSQMFLAKALAYALHVPFASGDSRGLTTTGQGNLLFQLLVASDFDVESAQHGVVYVAGVDQADAQGALMRLWQKNISEPIDHLQLDIRGILFVCGGEFTGLEEATSRLGRHPEQPVSPESLIGVGLRPECAICFTAIAHVTPLDEESLVRMVHWVDFGHVDKGTSRPRNFP
jgi:ATP-dependent Clp protease ATP-binding subunit ClpX